LTALPEVRRIASNPLHLSARRATFSILHLVGHQLLVVPRKVAKVDLRELRVVPDDITFSCKVELPVPPG
jgi:hypothetical protein